MTTQMNPPMMVRIGDDQAFLRVNPAFEARLGLTADDLIDKPFLKWIHSNDRDSLATLLDAETGSTTARHITKGGDSVLFSWEARADAEGCAVLGRLVTEDKPGIHEPRITSFVNDNPTNLPSRNFTSAAALTMSQTLEAMALVVESQNPGLYCSILLIDSEQEHVSVGAGPSLPQEYNDAVEGLKIGPRVGSCGTAAFWNVPVVVEDIDEDPLWVDLRGAAELAGVSACWSHPIVSINGTVLGAIALYNPTPRSPTDDQMRGLEIASRMVGLAIERDQLEVQVRQAAKMEALGVLAGGIAHDFNNLLAVVRGNAELAVDSLPTEAPARLLLADIVTASENAGDLCNQMLAYAGRGVQTIETIDCNALMQELGGLLRVALSKKANLSYELAGIPLGVKADRGQFKQVIMNLIKNASDALGNNPGSIVLTTSVERYELDAPELLNANGRLDPGDYVCLRVSDNGVGMDAATQSLVFDPFYSTKNEGRGLGLAVVQGIVVRHGGAIILDSEEGKGSTFSLLFPKVPLEAAPVVTTPEHESASAGAHILVVDDHLLVRNVMVKILEHAGYAVTCASDGQEAVDIFRDIANEIDCVLLDFSMPKLNGIEAFGELRAINSSVPVILCSGYTEEEILEKFRGTGLTYALQKLQPMDVLLAKVAEALEGARFAQAV
jgi:two-component system, cell cycle sensor histidine kinase and response regulator CckA